MHSVDRLVRTSLVQGLEVRVIPCLSHMLCVLCWLASVSYSYIQELPSFV